MQTTALIIRPPDAKPVRVLEVDGPRHGTHPDDRLYYRLSTSNHPPADWLASGFYAEPPLYLHDWNDPYWEIYQHADGSVHVHACRPTLDETIEGDLHGSLGSVIKLRFVNRSSLKKALRIARMLCSCAPEIGIELLESEVVGLAEIETDLPLSISFIP
jgi:hypothetical protein